MKPWPIHITPYPLLSLEQGLPVTHSDIPQCNLIKGDLYETEPHAHRIFFCQILYLYRTHWSGSDGRLSPKPLALFKREMRLDNKIDLLYYQQLQRILKGCDELRLHASYLKKQRGPIAQEKVEAITAIVNDIDNKVNAYIQNPRPSPQAYQQTLGNIYHDNSRHFATLAKRRSSVVPIIASILVAVNLIGIVIVQLYNRMTKPSRTLFWARQPQSKTIFEKAYGPRPPPRAP